MVYILIFRVFEEKRGRIDLNKKLFREENFECFIAAVVAYRKIKKTRVEYLRKIFSFNFASVSALSNIIRLHTNLYSAPLKKK